jgi:SNF2 family DNA or RNA helicase
MTNAKYCCFEGRCRRRIRAGCRKTLQGISLLWTLLQSGHALLGGEPLAKRVIICCPTSLVSNWDSECGKWLKVQQAHSLSCYLD